MTLNDLEWLEWPFYVNFLLLQLTLRVIVYLFTVEYVYIHTYTVIHVTSGDVRKRSSGP